MMVSIDKAGRVVIPKDVRVQLDLVPGTQLEIEVQRDSIRLEQHHQPGRTLLWSDDGRPYFPAAAGHTKTDIDVQQLRDSLQR
ncbi:MAG: AbrB/MazE/SpoVT family DNA-binding domain-containing protein [Propionicimonas sp.]|nr:AbrB/MazE/SpoVT family DNA-binding domain-containing protein [Propionicimonas sp.]